MADTLSSATPAAPAGGTDPLAVVKAFLSALGDLDIDRALTYTSPDIVYQNVPLPPARGRKDHPVAGLFRLAHRARCHGERPAAGGPLAAGPARPSRMTGPLRPRSHHREGRN